MTRIRGNSRWCAPLALFVIIIRTAAQAGAQGVPAATPIPSVTGPIPATAESYPLMAASKIQDVVDLPKLGYVEEEFFVSGRANVYDWADGTLSVRTAGALYTTRILVRRPADPRRSSGDVIVELPNMARRYDWSMTWALSHDYFIEHGDVWIGLTYAPVGIEALKMFNPTRYAPLSMANPTPDQVCPAAAPQGGGRQDGAPTAPSPTEEGLKWDIISQVGALPENPRLQRPPGGIHRAAGLFDLPRRRAPDLHRGSSPPRRSRQRPARL